MRTDIAYTICYSYSTDLIHCRCYIITKYARGIRALRKNLTVIIIEKDASLYEALYLFSLKVFIAGKKFVIKSILPTCNKTVSFPPSNFKQFLKSDSSDVIVLDFTKNVCISIMFY